MNNKSKRGFTIVELVVVITVIAILAAVLIPTLTSVIAKANLSADQVAAKNMNTALQLYEAEHGKPSSFYNARLALEELGFKGESNMQTTSKGYSYVWNSDDNVVMLVDEKAKVVYPVEYKSLTLDILKHNYLDSLAKQVEDTGEMNITTTDNITLDLDCSFKFAPDSGEALENNKYKEWGLASYFSFDKNATPTEQDGAYFALTSSNNELVAVSWYETFYDETASKAALVADKWYAIDGGLMYKNCSEFTFGACSAGAYDGITMSVELRLYEPKTNDIGYTDNYIVIHVYQYTFGQAE